MSDEYFAIGTITLKVEYKEEVCSHLILITPTQNHSTKTKNKEYILFHPCDPEKGTNEEIISYPKDKNFKINECIAKQLSSVATTSVSTKIIIKRSDGKLSVTGVEFPAK